MARIERNIIDETDDASGQAGWMFSDMLVALMVVFLATITFIPQFGNTGSTELNNGQNANTGQNGSTGTYSYVEHFEVAMVRAYHQNEVSLVLLDVASFLKANDLPADAIIDSAQFVGGYAPVEGSAVAIERAINFSKKLEKLAPRILEHASSVLNSSPKLAADLVTVRFTFSQRVNTN